MKSNIQSISKEDLFRSILTLHVLLENPPGDFTDSIRNEIISGFCDIFVQVRFVFNLVTSFFVFDTLF